MASVIKFKRALELIKPCPFCGEKPHISGDDGGWGEGPAWNVICHNKHCPIGLSHSPYKTLDDLVEGWNDRKEDRWVNPDAKLTLSAWRDLADKVKHVDDNDMPYINNRAVTIMLPKDGKVVPLQQLTIADFRQAPFEIAPNRCMLNGVVVDTFSASAVCQIYDALSNKKKDKFNDVVCKDGYKLASFLDGMWNLFGKPGK